MMDGKIFLLKIIEGEGNGNIEMARTWGKFILLDDINGCFIVGILV